MATSTYNDTTTATLVGPWTLIELNPGKEYRTDPSNTNSQQVRTHNVLTRYRILQGPAIYYVGQEGQVGVGADITAYYDELVAVAPTGTLGYLCTEDRIEVLFPNTFRQTQAWEHFTDFATFDVSDLA